MKRLHLLVQVLAFQAAFLSVAHALPGDLDPGFDPNVTGGDQKVHAIAVQPDGKIIIGGNFTAVGGTPRGHIARLTADGSADPTFNPGIGADNEVYCVAVQPDGKILVGGFFQNINSQNRSYLARLESDGSVDLSFNPGVWGSVYSIALQSDGSMFIGGGFSTVDGTSRKYVARLNGDGSLDPSFNTSNGPNSTVFSLALDAAGNVVIGGVFTTVGTTSRNRIARLLPTGALDPSFNPGSGANSNVQTVAIQTDQKILVGGYFTTMNGVARNRIARLHPNGSVEDTATFDPGSGVNGFLSSVVIQADGRILLGGEFTSIDSESHFRVARLRADGTPEGPDEFFVTNNIGNGPDDSVRGLTLQPDGNILIGGIFSEVGGEPRNRIARMANNPSNELLLGPSSTTVRWNRDGGASEIHWALFEHSSDGGTTWNPLGEGTRVPGGWELNGSGFPTSGLIRAIGLSSGAYNNGSSNIVVVESEIPQGPEIVVDHADTTNIPDGGGVTFPPVESGFSESLDLTIRNIGTTDLTDLSVTIDGPDADLFSITASPTAPVSGPFGTTGLTVEFTPTTVGLKTATLHIANNDTDEAPFDIALQGSLDIVDTSFDPDPSNMGGALGGKGIPACAIQPDGKILIGGSFTQVGSSLRTNIARLHPDGSVDQSFAPGLGPNNNVECIAIQHLDDTLKILIGGSFTTVDGQSKIAVARLNEDGSLDAGFDAGIINTGYRIAYNIVVQPDGRILIGGSIGTPIIRLNPDGSPDPSFGLSLPGLNFYCMALQNDGRILVGTNTGVLRLNADGSVDGTYSSVTSNYGIECIAVQADGKALVAGRFSTIAGQQLTRIARLDSSGIIDPTFDPGDGANANIYSVAVQADGRILAGGRFTNFDNTPANHIVRLEPDGSVESPTTFDPGSGVKLGTTTSSYAVYSIALQEDGAILVGGLYAGVNGHPRRGLARLHNQPSTQVLSVPDNQQIQWARGGGAPELAWVTFELSTDGVTNWMPRGEGVRVPGGWQLTGLSLPVTGAIRARGGTAGGYRNGSSGLVEQILSFPDGPEIVVEQPAGTNIPDGGTSDFGVVDVGTGTELEFTIRSIGSEQLTGLGTSITGADASLFTVTTSPSAPLPAPDGTTTFTVSFSPTSVGAKTAVLHIASNDVDESSFDIILTGTGEALDPDFDPGVTGLSVLATAAQQDGRILLGGDFSQVGGLQRNGIARLEPNGDIEPLATFDAGTGTNGPVRSIGVQRDGRIILAGDFTSYNEVPVGRILRIDPDGTVDAGFTPGDGADGTISAVALEDDGRMVIAGDFTAINSQPRTRLARLDADGVLVGTSDFNASADGPVHTVAVAADGDLVIGGAFATVNGQPRANIAKIGPDGTLDPAFDPGTDGPVKAIVIDPDGNILVGGGFSQIGGVSLNGIARLGPGGAVEAPATFDPGSGANDSVESIVLQTDGKILLGGAFTSLNSLPRFRIARLESNGTVEDTTSFNAGSGADGIIHALAQQDDGSILLGGGFSTLNGQPRSRFARFVNDPATQAVMVPGSALAQWIRSGAGPQLSQVNFDLSTDGGTNWTPLGPGTRIPGGWELDGLDLPATGSVRARGRAIGGAGNASSGLVEQVTLFANPPVVSTQPATDVLATTATLNGAVTPNGSAMVFFEYGTSPAYGSGTTPEEVTGASGTDVQAALAGLLGNTMYHCRIVAMNDAGTVYGDDVVFLTAPDPPLTITATPTTVTDTSATLVGSINPKGRETTVHFEYGPTTLYGSTTDPQVIPAGTSVVEVTETLTGLDPNSTLHYRLIATSSGGTAVGDDVSFVTNYPPPEATTGSASPLSTTSAQVSGTVRAFNTPTDVFFDWGTDGVTFPNSVAATPATVSDDTVTPVTGALVNLTQGLTFHYRIRAVSVGGVTIGGTATLTLDILSGLTQSFPSAPPPAQGFVFMTLNPDGPAFGWRFAGEQAWRGSGAVTGLATGDRVIEYRPVPGYIQPPPEVASVVSGGLPLILTSNYFTSAGGGATGDLNVTLKPSYLAEATVPEADRIQWRLLGEDDLQWRDSGVTITNLPPGPYLVECKPVSGRTTPRPASIVVTPGGTAAPTLTYFLADASSGALPTVLPFETVTTSTDLPYAYVGQIRSDVGSSTGFVVKSRVVASAGHVVFDDGTLSPVTGLQWLFQRDAGTYEPKPQIPRGFYLFDGYAAARSAPGVIPGESTQESQNLDVAALYFIADSGTGDPNLPGRGGFGGFLASDTTANEFLLSSAPKILVGYPVDDVVPAYQGRMHATAPLVGVPAEAPAFTQVFDRTYSTPDIRSTGGMSGAPLCVQYEGGNYYPAAIYLGGTAQTIVRSIDSNVIDLFNRAQTSGNGDGNNTGGGITHTSITGILDPTNPGAIRVLIEPAAAVSGGGGWRLNPETSYRMNGAIKSSLGPGTYVLEFSTVSGYPVPGPQTVTVTGGQLTTVTFSYEGSLTPLESWRLIHFGSSANTGAGADDMDPDLDGRTNIEEFSAGTDPNDPHDYFRLTGATRTATTFSATTDGRAGRSYALQRSNSLSSPTWTTVATEGPLAADGQVTLEDPAPPAGAAYYRFEATMP